MPQGAARAPFRAVRMLFLGFAVGAIGFARAESVVSRILEHIGSRDISVITVTDFTPAGHALPDVSPAHPAYFEALILGYNDWGRSIAGESVPAKKKMIQLILKVLSDRGYLPANAAHPPSLILAMAWGSMNHKPGISLHFMGGDKLDLMWELDPYIGGLLDPRVLTRGMRSGLADMIMQSASSDLYVLSIQAFDEVEAQHGRSVRLWHTKVSCPATGLEMDRSLYKMVRLAAPIIGRDTPRPILVTAPERTTKVEIGELKVIETIDLSRLPVTDISDDLAAAGRKAR